VYLTLSVIKFHREIEPVNSLQYGTNFNVAYELVFWMRAHCHATESHSSHILCYSLQFNVWYRTWLLSLDSIINIFLERSHYLHTACKFVEHNLKFLHRYYVCNRSLTNNISCANYRYVYISIPNFEFLYPRSFFFCYRYQHDNLQRGQLNESYSFSFLYYNT
jgi:hypothetical protein